MTSAVQTNNNLNLAQESSVNKDSSLEETICGITSARFEELASLTLMLGIAIGVCALAICVPNGAIVIPLLTLFAGVLFVGMVFEQMGQT